MILWTSAVSAAVLLGTLNLGTSGNARFSELFAVSMYASLPFVLHSLVTAVALRRARQWFIPVSNPVGSNLGYYLAPAFDPRGAVSPYSVQRLKMSEPFVPPKPNEFESAYSISASLGPPGT